MNADLDQAIKSAVSDIVAAAPAIADDPTDVTVTPISDVTSRRLLPAAAAVLIVAAGVTGIALASRGSPTQTGPSQTGPAATEQPVQSALTSPEPVRTAPTAPPTTLDPRLPCSDGIGETTVPNVAGMYSQLAIDTLSAAGLGVEAVPEASPNPETVTYGFTVAKQHTPPGTTLACGDVVMLTVADRPTARYTVQPGDTWESIAAAQGIVVQDLLDANGESGASPLDPGRTITLLLAPTLETVPPTTV